MLTVEPKRLTLLVVTHGYSLPRIAEAISTQHPEHQLVVLLCGSSTSAVELERWSDEVISVADTDVVAVQIDASQRTIELVNQRSQEGHKVVLLIDSLTSLARTYNKALGEEPVRLMVTGIEPKRLESLMRVLREKVTIVATVRTGTGSRIDEVVYELMSGIAAREIRWGNGS